LNGLNECSCLDHQTPERPVHSGIEEKEEQRNILEEKNQVYEY